MRTGIGVLLFLGLCCILPGYGQEISTAIYPTEEELEQAFANQEIDAAQFIELRELIRFGIDSSHSYLFDVIPNLLYSSRIFGLLEALQAQPFQKAPVADGFPRVTWKLSYARRLEGDSLYRHFESMQTQFNHHVSSDIKLGKEYTSDIRMLSRSVTYQNKQRSLRKVIAGNYYTRFGLGGVIGYRSPITQSEESFTDESVLFPDYTGYNGLFVDSRIDGRKYIGLLSVQRDSAHAMVTGAGLIGLSANSRIPELIVSVTSVRSRSTHVSRAIATGSLFTTQMYKAGHLNAEVMAQGDEELYPAGALVSGVHRSSDISISYRGWLYSDKFIDMTSGGYSGRVRRENEIEQVSLAFSDRHRGQEGFTVRTSADVGHGRKFLADGTVASVNADTVDIQLLLGLTAPLGKVADGRIDYLATDKMHNGAAGAPSRTIHQIRTEATFRLGRFSSRQYIAVRWDDNAGQLGIFCNPRYTLNNNAEIEAWYSGRGAALNDADSGYSYMFIRTTYHVFTNGLFSVKFSHRFDQENGSGGQSTVTGNLELVW